ncbi:pilus assembly protein N-terminal domain-containing protein [bacterium]|nr:pilus assembly protein N-terminal domain-containing protein [bacterium]
MLQCTSHNRRLVWSAVVLGAMLWLLATAVVQAGGLSPTSTRALTVPTGRSALLHFQRMKRVQVVEPDLVEVVVGSLDDLSIYGKKAGDTIVYVWDRLGMHQIAVTVAGCSPAEALVLDLRAVLGNRLSYATAGERTVVIEGVLSGAAAQRAHDIISASGRENVQIVDLVRTEGDDAAGAAAAVAAGLAKILGDTVEYTVWNNTTLIVRGGLGDREKLAQAHKLLLAISDPRVKVVDLLEYQEGAAEPPVARITQALGKDFRVWQVAGRTVAVEGTVASAEQLEDLNKILEAFKDQATIVNLVRVGKPDINRAVASLQSVVGNKVTVRSLDAETIAIEGLVGNEAELTRMRDIVKAYPVGYKTLDLLRVALQEKRQVLIQVRVVDINKGDLKRLGVTWGQLSVEEDAVKFVDQPWVVQALGAFMNGTGDAGNVVPIGAQLDMLREKNAARVLSEPNLLVDDGGSAMITVGGEIPVPISQTGGTSGAGGAISVEWKPYGVLMQVQPTILEGSEKISLKVAPEVSSLDYSNAVTISGFSLPAMRQRKASTTVTVENGGTLVVGGLIQREESKIVTKIPILGDLPILGELFRHKEFQTGDSELVILVTPQIVTGPVAIPASATPQGGLIAPAQRTPAPAQPAQ